MAVVERGVRVNEFGVTDQLAFAAGSPVDSKAADLMKELYRRDKEDQWLVATGPTTCKCIYCIEDGRLDIAHEAQRVTEREKDAKQRAARQEELDRRGPKHPHNRGHWVYDNHSGNGREL